MPSNEPRQASRKTFAWLFQSGVRTAARDGDSSWRIKGSGVSDPCEYAEKTKAVVAFLESVGIPVKRSGTSGFCAADTHSLDADFLDGGLWAETGNYIGGEKGAWINGKRAALFVALGLGLRVTEALRERYSLPQATLAELLSEAGNAVGL